MPELNDPDRKSRFFVNAKNQPLVEMADVTALNADHRDQGRSLELISNAITGSDTLLIGLYWLAPGERHLLHHHPAEAEFYYVVEGGGRFTAGDEELQAEPGVAVYLPPGIPHAIENNTEKDLCVLWGFDRADVKDITMIWDE